MYTENVNLTNAYAVSTDYYVNTPQYTPVQEPVNNTFQEILDNAAGAAATQNQTYPAAPVSQTEETENNIVNGYYPAPSAPPVTKPSEPAEAFYIDKYYSISESEVIQGIRDVRKIINAEDLSAKTDIEKYTWIEKQFIDAFGEDFMMARNLSMPSSMFYMIGIEFNDTINRLIEEPAQVNRERLFGDKSTEDIQKSIRDKFPEVLTNRDLFLMVNEMRNSGVLDADSLRQIGKEGANNIFDTLNLLRSYAKISTQNSDDEIGKLTLEERDRRWASILNNPVNLNTLMRLYNAWSQDGRFSMGSDIASFIANFLGGEKDENGLFIINNHGAQDGNHGQGGGPIYINYVGGADYSSGNIHNGDNGPTNINISSGVSGNSNGFGNVKGEPEEDWDKMLDMMLKGMDEYDDLIRSRMELINAEEPPVIDENPEVDDNPGEGADEAPGAEENVDSGEGEGSSEGGGSGEGQGEAA